MLPTGSPMTVRGGGVPCPSMASTPFNRMGPPPRSLLPMRITASWSGSLARRIQGCGTIIRPPTRSSPRTSSSRPPQVCRRARSPQGQGPYGVALRAILDRSCARRPYRSLWVGTKKRAAQVEQRNEGTRKWIGPLRHPLAKNRPIQGMVSPILLVEHNVVQSLALAIAAT
jgi:hypothetical protein